MNEREKSPDQRQAELESELRIFQDGMNSPFWKMLVEDWKPLVDKVTYMALSPNVTDRSYAAGKANGQFSFMNYPESHIRRLQIELKTLREVKNRP